MQCLPGHPIPISWGFKIQRACSPGCSFTSLCTWERCLYLPHMCPINITEICTRIHYRMYHQSVCVWWSPPKLFFNGHFGRPSSNSHQLKSRINYRDTLPAPRKNGVTLVAWGWERALLAEMATTTAAQEDNAELE